VSQSWVVSRSSLGVSLESVPWVPRSVVRRRARRPRGESATASPAEPSIGPKGSVLDSCRRDWRLSTGLL